MSPTIDETICPTSQPAAQASCSSRTGTRLLRLGATAPLIIALSACCDLALRFLPPHLLSFRAHEALRAYRAQSGPFRPNARVECSRTYGDLANLGNLPQYREYRSEIATTDALGYRNLPSLTASGPPDVLMVGDSFTLGTGLNDHETVPARLSERLDARFYNMGSQEAAPSLETVLNVAERTGMRSGLILFQHLERKDPPARAELHRSAERFPVWLRTPIEYSPLKILLSRLQRNTLNDKLFPNPHARAVRVLELRNGDSMLFHAEEFTAAARAGRSLDISYWTGLSGELSTRGYRLAVFSAPDKLSIYRELLDNPASVPAASSYLHDLTAKLNASGIPALDLTGRMRSEARLTAARHQSLYWRDDTHWNRRGADIAAAEVARWLAREHLLHPARRE